MLVFLTSGCNQHVSGRAKLAVLHPDRCLLALTYLLTRSFACLLACCCRLHGCRSSLLLADISFELLGQRTRLVPVSWKRWDGF